MHNHRAIIEINHYGTLRSSFARVPSRSRRISSGSTHIHVYTSPLISVFIRRGQWHGARGVLASVSSPRDYITGGGGDCKQSATRQIALCNQPARVFRRQLSRLFEASRFIFPNVAFYCWRRCVYRLTRWRVYSRFIRPFVRFAGEIFAPEERNGTRVVYWEIEIEFGKKLSAN